uniref:Neurotransmitter-gated ion-channel ligand-binding domain-containing protein n=1 Tax=Biomphalaria glabrata TaxID=6526 RepID=A0A2C9LDJ7_BIOGL
MMTYDLVQPHSTKVSTYVRIRTELLNRSVAVHKISPELDCTVGQPFELNFNLLIFDVTDFDQISQQMTIIAHVQTEWNQTDLSWNKTDYENMDAVLLESSAIWTPTIYVIVGSKESITFQLNDNLIVTSNGNVKSMIQTYITFRCQIDFNKYPFDTQTCSFGFYKEDLHIFNSDLKANCDRIIVPFDNYTIKGEWQLTDFYCHMTRDLNNATHFRYWVVARRRSVYYVITVVFPMVLTSVMIPLVFLIPTKTGEKISYLVTMFTSTAIFLSYISTVMPRSLTNLPYLSLLLVEVLCEGLCAVLATLWVVNKYNLHPVDLKRTTKIHPSTDVGTDQKATHPVDSLDISNVSRDSNLEHWSKLQRTDRFLFIVFASVQFLFLLCLFAATEWILH